MKKTVKQIFKMARGNWTQEEFAKKLGKSQGLLSKYERGTANPPSSVIEKCWSIIDNRDAKDAASSDMLAKRIKKELKKPEYAFARKTIVALLDGIQASNQKG